MYKVLVVDDEIYVTKSLIATINWSETGFEVIGQADNGVDAFNMIMELKPDLVFTDIKMPGLSGLELIKNVNEKTMSVIFVVISGYAEFAYAQKAMNYGALGYCLKPFEDSEITNVLLKAKGILDKNKITLETSLLELIEDKSSDQSPEARDIFRMLNFEYGSESRIWVLVSIGRLHLPPGISHIHLEIGSSKNAYLIRYEDAERIREYFAGTFPENLRGVGMVSSYCTFGNIKKVLDEAVITANQFFITGRKGFYEGTISNNDELNQAVILLEKAFETKRTTEIIKELELISTLFQRNICDIRFALRVYNMVMTFLYMLDTVKFEDYVYNCDQLTSLFEDAQQLLVYLRELTARHANGTNNSIPEDVRNETFKRILQYVNANYTRNISIQSLSILFTINPSYVSQLFKKELDVTFTDYITRLRISYACNLLKITDLPVYEIAEKAGYDEYYYFTRVFKKIMGKTPSELRGGKL